MRTFTSVCGIGLIVGGLLAGVPEVSGSERVSTATSANAAMATAASGYKDCSPNNGFVAITAHFWSNSGLYAWIRFGAGGGGGSTSWSRTIDPELYKPLSHPRWTISTPLAKGDWDAVEERTAGDGVIEKLAQCTVKPLRTGTPKKTITLGARDCPDGEVVRIRSSGTGNHWFEWDIGTSKRRVSMSQYGGLLEFFAVYTRANKIGGAKVRAYKLDVDGETNAFLTDATTACISANHWKPGD